MLKGVVHLPNRSEAIHVSELRSFLLITKSISRPTTASAAVAHSRRAKLGSTVMPMESADHTACSIDVKSTCIVLPSHFAGSGKRAQTFATIQGFSGFAQVKPEDR